MSYYYVKNIKIDRKNNVISADLADNNLEPLYWFHVDDLCNKKTFKEKYANFIYNLVTGNFHPYSSNKYSKIVMNNYLKNYYDDAHDIGELKTYDKYENVVTVILNGEYSNLNILPSDREIRPDFYYKLHPLDIVTDYKLSYYKNDKGELYGFDGNKLHYCDSSEKNYGYPLSIPFDIHQFEKYNSFLKYRSNNKEDTGMVMEM